MNAPYSWVNPNDIVDLSPEKAIRKAFSRTFSPPGLPELDPDKPMPVMLGFTLMFTRPHPTIPGNNLWSPVVLLRWPGSIEMMATQFLRSDSILDVHHATVRGHTHALFALSDAQFKDDVEETGNTRLMVPPNPIGWALDRAAGKVGAQCRQWKAKDGSRLWGNMAQETKQAEIALGLSVGSVAQMIENVAQLTPSETVDIADFLEELGFTRRME
ncbi:MAG: hypothetical protein F4W95_07725 [Chloroflexi bacterium]|nr:hypothetical protein [Chloroflexota bacterium]MYD48359.1 hypothetical protein [Chloroflexota bacterium]